MRVIKGWILLNHERICCYGAILTFPDGTVVFPEISLRRADVEFFGGMIHYFSIKSKDQAKELAADYINMLAKYT